MGTKTMLVLSHIISNRGYPIVTSATLGSYTVSGSQESAVAAIEGLNKTLSNACVAVGGVLIAIAIVRIILAMATEDAKGKTDSGMIFGAGIVFISISGVIELLGIKDISGTTSGGIMAERIISVVGKALSYVGVIIFLFAVISLIIAIAQENSDSYVTSSKMIMIAVAMLGADGVLSGVRALIRNGNTNANTWVNAIVVQVANIATWGALGLCTCGIFKLVMGIRTEDDRDRNTGIRFLMAGIALVGIRAIFAMFGFTNK